ncbi:hypothetical protein CPB84DRAFT_1851933 [Gymnopilus junonius]|uniref:Uncharacterized protein n=1 Tax=Gymnopilus junonius TaxID=109634 RepID=A0A9P5TH13_GYMJU|nr:hypothetical protein CPB84DRAFT_1851933 [Gymnopilus junonius]
MDEQEPWHLTIILLEGLRLMRPEKAWRPIVTVEVDKHYTYETTLGVDGQCVNQKEIFKFSDARSSSQVHLQVWYRSQSKKKKRKILVASASHCLGELLKKQGTDSMLSALARPVEEGPREVAVLRLRIKAPEGCDERDYENRTKPPWQDSGSSGDDTDDSASVRTDHNPLDDLSVEHFTSSPPQSGIRRRKVKGYAINSDDDISSYETDDEFSPENQQDDHSNTVLRQYINFDSGGDGWVAFSDLPLPLYTEKITVPPNMTRIERVLSSVTMYREMSAAEREEDFEPVARRLQAEWTFIGGLLLALAAVDTAVFSISPGSIFNVDSWAKSAIATSSIASGLGIACDAWFLLRYGWADLPTFMSRSRDLYSSHFFFSLSSRTPTFCTFLSALSLMAFLGIVAYDAWPSAVLMLSFLVGIIMSLQFLVYGIHWCAKKVAAGGRAGGRGVVSVVRVVRRSMSGGLVDV